MRMGVDVKGNHRTFFPGEPDKARWVPIFRESASGTSAENVLRKQFPLVLAWAITHWKAQGMTLRRTRVHLGSKAAATAGVGFTAVTRVRHPTHMVFDVDLPDWLVFQSVQYTPAYRRRRRFELRLQAKASGTIRKYGFCEADGEQWSESERRRADTLLSRLRAVREMQRARLVPTGHRTDEEAYLWPEGEPAYKDILLGACREVLASGQGATDPDGYLGEASRAAYNAVALRLLSDLHMPAVKEALGALVPADLHPLLDKATQRGKKRATAGAGRIGVHLHACGWRVI